MAVKPNFLTVPQELQAVAHTCYTHLVSEGCIPKCEYAEEHFPETATIYCRKKSARHFYIVDIKIRDDRISLWSAYGRSCSTGTYVTLCIPDEVTLPAASIVKMQEAGVGLLAIGGVPKEIVAAIDLTVNITLPPLSRQKGKRRTELAAGHKRFAKGDWKAGFEHACKIVEKYSRKYLAGDAKVGRVHVVGKKGNATLVSEKEVIRMPLGALADVFCKRINQSQIDSLLCGGLKRINPDRIGVAHDKLSARDERRLRKNVGHHMWTIDNLLRAIPS